MMPGIMDQLLTVKELARMLNCKVSYVYQLNFERRGPRIVRLGPQQIRYRLSNVEERLIEQTEATERVGDHAKY